MFKLSRGVTGILVFALAAEAQAPAQDWNAVKSLAAGTEVRVKAGPRAITGSVQSATDDALTVSSGNGPQTLARQEIAQVSVRKRGNRGRNALIGLGIGAGIGLLGGVITDSKCAGGSCFVDKSLGKAILTPLGAILGTIVGAVWPTGGWREVYKR